MKEVPVVLLGEVVEAFDRDGKRLAKISLRSICIDVPLDSLYDAHLGDPVAIDAGITIYKLAQVLSEPPEEKSL